MKFESYIPSQKFRDGGVISNAMFSDNARIEVEATVTLDGAQKTLKSSPSDPESMVTRFADSRVYAFDARIGMSTPIWVEDPRAIKVFNSVQKATIPNYNYGRLDIANDGPFDGVSPDGWKVESQGRINYFGYAKQVLNASIIHDKVTIDPPKLSNLRQRAFLLSRNFNFRCFGDLA